MRSFQQAKEEEGKRIHTLVSIAVVILVIPGVLWRAWVLTVMWRVFIAEHFSLPHLTLPVAIGISLIAAYLTYQPEEHYGEEHTTDEKISNLIYKIGLMALVPAFALVLTWIVSWWM